MLAFLPKIGKTRKEIIVPDECVTYKDITHCAIHQCNPHQNSATSNDTPNRKKNSSLEFEFYFFTDGKFLLSLSLDCCKSSNDSRAIICSAKPLRSYLLHIIIIMEE